MSSAWRQFKENICHEEKQECHECSVMAAFLNNLGTTSQWDGQKQSNTSGGLTCTPGLTGVRGYTCGKQTVCPYTGCWTMMEGLGWPWGRGGVGVLAGLGWSDIFNRLNLKERSARLVIWCGIAVELTCVLNLGLNSFAFGLRVDFLTCLQVGGEKVHD